MKKSILVLLLLAVFLLAGCAGGNQPEETVPEGTGTAAPETDAPHPSISLTNEEGKPMYQIVIPKEESSALGGTASSLCKAVSKKTGAEFAVSDDSFRRADFEDLSLRYEILIGQTDRDESRDLLASLKDSSFAVAVRNRKVLILGTSEALTLRAADYFIGNIVPDLSVLTEGFLYTETARDPSSVRLKSTATGKVNPRIVKTVYPTEDVVVADIVVTDDGYAVIADGSADCTKGIQKALDDCYKHGGGTVYLPAGIYAVCGQLRIPEYVTLRGDWQDPDTGSDYGTVIEVWSKSKDDALSGTVMLGGSGGVYGLTFYYPEQSVNSVKPYPFTLYADGVGNRYMLQTVKNVTILNGYRGIGACCSGGNAHEQLTVDNVKGTFLMTAAEVYNQADVGTWQSVKISTKYWKELGGGRARPDASTLDEYVKEKTVGLILGDLEWTEFHDLQVDGCKIGINVVKGKRIEFAGSLYDIAITNCGTGIRVDSLDTRWGMVIARSTVENGIVNRTSGAVKLCDVKTTGKNTGAILKTDGDLKAYSVRNTAAFVKPAEILYVADLPKQNTGKNASPTLQKLLDEAGKTGGVVYVPGGVYRFSSPLTVPAGVELRGTASVATRDQGGDANGTVFFSYVKGGENDTPFITLKEGAGVNGIRIHYPENTPYGANLKTSYAVKGEGKNVYILNSAIVGAGYGVDFRGCDNHFIKKVTTCCYYVTFCLGGKNGTLIGCLQNGTVLTRCAVPGRTQPLGEGRIFDDLFNPILRKVCSYIRLEGADGENILNTFAYGCATFLTCKDSTNSLVVNVGCDNIGTLQTRMESGSLTVINAMRYNGQSYSHSRGTLNLFNRLTINNKEEETYNKTK